MPMVRVSNGGTDLGLDAGYAIGGRFVTDRPTPVSLPVSESSVFGYEYAIGTKGYSTIRVQTALNVNALGIKSDGTLEVIGYYGGGIGASVNIPVTGYDYVFISSYANVTFSCTISIS